MEDWEVMYVDQIRIVGLKLSESFVIGVPDNASRSLCFAGRGVTMTKSLKNVDG